MKAGSLQSDDDAWSTLRESRASPSSGEVCLEVCSRLVSLCLHLFFITVLVLGLWPLVFDASTKHPSPKTKDRLYACVAEQLKPLTVNQASLKRLRRCESYRMHHGSALIFLLSQSKRIQHKAQKSVITPPVCQNSTRSLFWNTPRRQ
jgi:hypothetical protein